MPALSYAELMRSLLLVLLLTNPAFANPDESLDRVAISDGVAKVKSKILDCGKSSSASGTVKIKVEVAPAGTVRSATVTATPEQALGDCVAAVMKTATFRATLNGGSFSYPFVFGGKSSPPAEAPPDPDPDTLDRAAISEGMAKLKPQIMACGNVSKAKGSVKIKVEVAPSGAVSATTIVATPEQALGECVAGVIKKGTFRKTAKGGTFTYPFVF